MRTSSSQPAETPNPESAFSGMDLFLVVSSDHSRLVIGPFCSCRLMLPQQRVSSLWPAAKSSSEFFCRTNLFRPVGLERHHHRHARCHSILDACVHFRGLEDRIDKVPCVRLLQIPRGFH